MLRVGAPFLRQHPYLQWELTACSTRLVVVVDDPAEAHRAPAELAVVTALPDFCVRLARSTAPHPPTDPGIAPRAPIPEPPAPGEPLRPVHVLAELARRLPP